MNILYKDCNIPAQLYYEIMYSGDYSKLGEGTPEELENAFEAIVDEHFKLYPNDTALEYMRKRANIQVLAAQITVIGNTIRFMAFSSLTNEERNEIGRELNNIKGVKVKFDESKPIEDELLRIENKVVGFLKNMLNAEIGDKKEQGERQAFNFWEELTNICTVLEMHLPDDITLHRYESYKKNARAKIATNTKHTTKNGE